MTSRRHAPSSSPNGADVSEAFHFDGFTGPRLPGPDPERRSYGSYASFSDPDGNSWLLQEVKTRLPGRGLSLDVATLTELLREAETAPWRVRADRSEAPLVGWYAAYIVARERGKTPTMRPQPPGSMSLVTLAAQG